MSLKFVLLKTLYVSHRNWMERRSPHLKFLNSAISVLKMFGRRATFLTRSPRSPKRVGKLKHSAFKKIGVPSESTPLISPGSHVVCGNAFVDPPVKSVIAIQVRGALGAAKDPAGHVCPLLIFAVPLL